MYTVRNDLCNNYQKIIPKKMSTKKYICSGVKYAYGFEVSAVTESDITLKSGYTLHEIASLSANLSQDVKSNDSGPVHHQTLTVTTDETNQDASLFEQDLIFKLSLEDSGVIILGSLTEPARHTGGNPELEGGKFTFERFSVDRLL
jgi:hypothetical protein